MATRTITGSRTIAGARTISGAETIAGTRNPLITPPSAPIFLSAEIGYVSDSKVVVVFSASLTAADAKLGFTVTVGGSPVTIDSGTIVSESVQLTLHTAVVYGNVLTVAYSATTGTLLGDSNIPVATFSAQSVTNHVAAVGTTYYVRTDGNDSHTGLGNTSALAWRHIQKATDTMVAGDTVNIANGTYNEQVDLTGTHGTEGKSGTSGSYITYKGQTRDGVIVGGSHDHGWGFMSGITCAVAKCMNFIRIQDLSVLHCNVTGIEFFKDKDDGIYSSTASHDVIIDNVLSTHHGNGGIFFCGGDTHPGYNIIINNCEASYCDGSHHGIKFSGDAREITNGEHLYNSSITNCSAHHNTQNGIHCSSGNYNVTITGNTSHDNGSQGIDGFQNWNCNYSNNISYSNGVCGIKNGLCLGNTYSNNLLYNNTSHGLEINNDTGAVNTNHIVYNNVIYGNNHGIDCTNQGADVFYHNTITNNTYGLYCHGEISANTWKDNAIVHNATQEYFQDAAKETCDYNCWHPASTVSGHKGAHCFVGDPLFTTEFTNLHITAGSSCIGTGVDVSGQSFDKDGLAWPSPADVGAYKYV